MAPKVTVFIDYQNLHLSGHALFCAYGAPLEDCLLDPLKVALRLVQGRAPGGVLHQVRVYRGRPDSRKQPTLTAATDREAAAWSADGRVNMLQRQLWYPQDYGEAGCVERPREKGIDVSLAIDVVRLAMLEEYEVGIIVSRDTDLLPAVEAVVELGKGHIEVATWVGASRLRLPFGRRLWCHQLTEADFVACRHQRT